MKLGLILIITFTLISCDAPQRTRNPYGNPYKTDVSGIDVNGNSTDDTTKEDTEQQNEDDTVVPPTTVAAGFENCNLNYQYYGNNIGQFGLCQSSLEETKFKIKMGTSDTTEGTCFVPVNVSTSGTSFKLGIAECVRNEANKEYDMILTKERSEPINGVMVIKYNALGPYMDCMNAKVNFINSYPNCSYDQSCLNAANNYAAGVCNQFVQTFQNYYKQILLNN